MENSITQTAPALPNSERLEFAETAAKAIGQMEGILLAALADGDDAAIQSALRVVRIWLAELMPGLRRYGR